MTIFYVVNVEAVIVRDGRYLMIVRSEQEDHAPGALSVPGGKVEDAGFTNDILEETLRREVREEVGVEIEDEITYVESKSFISDDDQPVVDIVFLCRYRSGEATAVDSAEVAGLEWMTAAEVLSHSRTPSFTAQSIALAEERRLALGW